jgi:hypothetical protein
MTGEDDLTALGTKFYHSLQRALGQLEQSDEARISAQFSSFLDDIIDLAQDCRRHGDN